MNYMKLFLLINSLFFPAMIFSQSLILYTTSTTKKLCITNFEKNETFILDTSCNYKIKSYLVKEDSLVCITEDGIKKSFSNTSFKQLLIKKNDFINNVDNHTILSYYHNNYELKEIDYNLILCNNQQIKWGIINSRNGRKPQCNSKDEDINRNLTIFAHPILSNKGDFFIYNLEKWNWLSSSYKTYEVDMNTGIQIKLFNGLNSQISPTDQFILFMDLRKRYFIYNRKNKQRNIFEASSAFWLYN